MHQVIGIICYAETKEEARERAEDILNNNLVGEDKPFDYGTFFDEDGGGVAGSSRWGNRTPVCLADSKEGKKLIKDGMKWTKDNFIEQIEKVREIINSYSNDELFEQKVLNIKSKILESLENKKENKLSLFKYYCYCLGQYKGTAIYLYDDDGEGINESEQLKNVLNKWGEKNINKVFVIPIDCHS